MSSAAGGTRGERAASHRPGGGALGLATANLDPWVQAGEAKHAWSSGPGEWCFVEAALGRTPMQPLSASSRPWGWTCMLAGGQGLGWAGVSLPCWALGLGQVVPGEKPRRPGSEPAPGPSAVPSQAE